MVVILYRKMLSQQSLIYFISSIILNKKTQIVFCLIKDDDPLTNTIETQRVEIYKTAILILR